MIGGRHRFHGYGSLRAVYQHGQTIRSGPLTLKVAQRDQLKPYRLAVVVSRKVSKSAVVRNRIRRRVYEAFRQGQQEIAPGTDLVVTVFDERVAEMPPAKLSATIDELLRKSRA